VPEVPIDHIYWTFSAAAQSIAAFVAFLLTGYTLMDNMLVAAQARDETLEDVHALIRAGYHKLLGAFVWLTAAAIALSLLVVYYNRPGDPAAGWLLAIAAGADALAIICGTSFVIRIVDPKKYQRAARRAIRVETTSTTKADSDTVFFHAFLHLERLIRDYLKRNGFYVPSRGAPRMSYSFRRMVDALLAEERIDDSTYRDLLALSRYRNLVFHGHVHRVDAAMTEQARILAARIEALG
jgi:hypothetical protein